MEAESTSEPRTICVSIGNSDDKLTQVEWAKFVRHVDAIVMLHAADIHFHGFANADLPWQNACWVCTARTDALDGLRVRLREAAARARQESIALTIGTTEFIAPE